MKDNFPTWENVNIPALFVDFLRKASPSFQVDCLIHQLVFLHQRRVVYTYSCDRCGHHFNMPRSEEPTNCENCGSARFHALASVRFTKEKMPRYSAASGGVKFAQLINQTASIFYRRFHYYAHELFNCGWNTDGSTLYCQFLGGEKAIDRSPRMCIIKAILLCPYLWEFYSDWRISEHDSVMHGEHFSPILMNVFCR